MNAAQTNIMARPGRKKRKKMTMTVDGQVKLRRWLGDGWLVEGASILVKKENKMWAAYEKGQHAVKLATGRTLAEVIENATTVWVCSACGDTCCGAEDIRGHAHILCSESTGDATERGEWELFASPLLYANVIRPGLRVNDDFLGPGTVVDFIDSDKVSVMVRYDQDPPYFYNMCENPTIAFTHKLDRYQW